jgi:hypothetical protein
MSEVPAEPEVDPPEVVAVAGPAPDAAAGDPAVTDDALPLVASLVQWHNRWPWARRLQAAQVSGLGLVKLALSDDAAARPLYPPQTLVPGVSAARLRRFVRRHGYDERPGPPDWPVRELGPDPALPEAPVRWRYLMTAAYPAGSTESLLRVLAGRVNGAKAMPFVGRRALSPQRLQRSLAAAGGVLLLLGALIGWWQTRGATPSASVANPPGAASAAVAASQGLSTALAASEVDATASGASAVAIASTPVASGGVHTGPGPAADIASTPPSAVAASAAARAASASAGPLENLLVPAAASSPGVSTVTPPPRYALVSSPQADPRGSAARAMERLVSQSQSLRAQDRRLEWMPSPDGQVLTLWPFDDKAEAERLARKLQRQGLSLQVVAF